MDVESNDNEFVEKKFYGQNLQDRYVYEHFLKDLTGGMFLDIGASDGERFSNTLFFEESMGYTGICIEPRKVAFKALVERRPGSFCENVAIDSEEKEEALFLELKGYGSGLSGLLDRYDPRHVKRISWEKNNPGNEGQDVIKVRTVKLESILDKYHMHDFDVCSLDVEGAELEILKSIDWEKTTIRVLIVENNYGDPELRKYLESVGMKYKCTLARQDEIYVNF